MDITITISTDNAAFTDDPGAEVARILHKLASNIKDCGIEPPSFTIPLFDLNGNKVGHMTMTDTTGYDCSAQLDNHPNVSNGFEDDSLDEED